MATGVKISLPGKNVLTCGAKDCSLHSEYTAFKARKIGSVNLVANQWQQIDHNFGYEPAYFGWYSGQAGGLSGIAPFGGSPLFSGNAWVNSHLQSYTTTSSLFLKSSINTTAYYYLFADLAGKESDNIPQGDYGEFGLMISKPGVDVRQALPHQLNFLSTYPNFKVKDEFASSGTVISKEPTQQGIGQNDTTIYFPDANKYGQIGEIMLFGWETIHIEEWHWTLAETPGGNADDEAYSQGFFMKLHTNNGDYSGYWQPWDQGGDVEFVQSERCFRYKKNGEWLWINGSQGFTLAPYPNWNNKTTWWRSSDNAWLEVTSLNSYWDIIYYPIYNYNTYEFRNERVRFNNSNSSAFLNCQRGQGGTTARSWRTGIHIKPLTTIFQIASNPFSYTPAFLAWSIGPFEADNASGLPLYTTNSSKQIILSSNKFYEVRCNDWQGESDPFVYGSLPYVDSGCFLKIMYDELGT